MSDPVLQIIGPTVAGVVEVRVVTSTMIVERPTKTAVIDLITRGPMGNPGPQGVQGVQGVEGDQGEQGPYAPTLTMHFAEPSTEWVVVHNFGTTPVVTTVDLNNELIEGDVSLPDKTHVVISFVVPFAGTAILKA